MFVPIIFHQLIRISRITHLEFHGASQQPRAQTPILTHFISLVSFKTLQWFETNYLRQILSSLRHRLDEVLIPTLVLKSVNVFFRLLHADVREKVLLGPVQVAAQEAA